VSVGKAGRLKFKENDRRRRSLLPGKREAAATMEEIKRVNPKRKKIICGVKKNRGEKVLY